MKSSVSVDFDNVVGKIRRLNGGNLGTRFKMGFCHPEEREEFRRLEIPLTRLHDAPLANSGMRLVDVHCIFANFDADADDPRNYYFDETDELVRRLLTDGTEILYRLGTSIEHVEPHFLTRPPKDNAKWAKICKNIIRHYNHGWNNGMCAGIRYWEIWNEPDDCRCFVQGESRMWGGTTEQFIDLYVTAAKAIKEEFPEVKVGGAAFWKVNPTYSTGDNLFLYKFLRACKNQGAPLDFFSWHSYGGPSNPFGLLQEPFTAQELLHSFGFYNTELHLNEWRYIENWGGKFNQLLEKNHMAGAKSAVHATATLTGWQDTPLDMANFYTIGTLGVGWGCWYGWGGHTKIYSAFEAMAVMNHHAQRLAAATDTKNMFVLAGRNDDGKTAIMISDFCTDATEIAVATGGRKFSVRIMNENSELDDAPVLMEGDVLSLNATAGEPALYLLEEV